MVYVIVPSVAWSLGYISMSYPQRPLGQRHDLRTFMHAWLKNAKPPIQPQDKQSSAEMKIPYSTASYFPHLQRGIKNVTIAKTAHRVVLVQLLHVKLFLLQVRLPSWWMHTVLDKMMCTTEAIWWLGTEITISLRPLELETAARVAWINVTLCGTKLINMNS